MRKVFQVYNKEGIPLFATIRKDWTLHFAGLTKEIIENHFINNGLIKQWD